MSQISTKFLSNNVATNAKLAQMPANTLKGNNAGGSADSTDLSVSDVQTMLSVPVNPVWVSYTPTIVPNSGTVDNSTVTGLWRQIGDSMQIRGHVSFSASSGTWTRLQVTIPAGYTIDTSKILSTVTTTLGYGVALDNLTADYDLKVRYNTTTNFNVVVMRTNATYAIEEDITSSVPISWDTGDEIDWFVEVPITEFA